VAKQKLDLFEFASTTMAEPGASATKIVGCQVDYAGLTGTSLHRIPDYVGCHAGFLSRSVLQNCSEPRLTFNRTVVVRYRSFLERLSLSAATINLHLSAIRRLADESAESGWLSPELAIGIRRVKGVKRLGRKSGNWLTRNQAQDPVNAASKTNLRGRRDGAMLGLLLGCGLRRSEVVGLRLDQLQSREGHWVIVDLVGKGGRLRTVPVPSWCKELVDTWVRHSGVSEGKIFRRVPGDKPFDGVCAAPPRVNRSKRIKHGRLGLFQFRDGQGRGATDRIGMPL
jgi:integrase